MRRLSRRDRVLLAIWAAVVVVLALVIAVALPMRMRWKTLDGEVLSLQRTIAEAAAMYRQAPELTKEIKELGDTARALSRSGKEVGPTLIKEVDQLTKDLGIRLLSVRPGEPQTLEQCRKHTAVFEVECDFAGVARMLYELEQPPHPLWVEGVEISSDRTAENEVRAKVSVAVYTLRSASEKKDEKS